MKSVAITGLHRGENPQPGAAVAAALRRSFPDLRIVGLSYDPFESGLYCPDGSGPDAAYLMPYPSAGPMALAERLDEIQKRERIGFVVPCLDSEITNFIAIRQRLKKRHGIECALPTRKAFDARNKDNLHALCKRLDVVTPRTQAANSSEALAVCAEAIGYPVYVKGRFYEAHLVNSKRDLCAAFDEIAGVWGGPVLVQEPIVGEEYDVVGLGDGEGGIIGSCSIRKMLRTSAGKGFAGIVIVDPALDELVERIVQALRWQGPFELEFIKAPHGRHVLLEMNPRFPAWIDFPAQIGCNLPERLLEDFLGAEPTPLRDCSPGQMFIRHSIDVVTDIGDLARMVITGERIRQPVGSKPELEVIK